MNYGPKWTIEFNSDANDFDDRVPAQSNELDFHRCSNR